MINNLQFIYHQLVAFLSYAFGDFDILLGSLCILIVLDYLTSLFKLIFTKTIDVGLGYCSILKKICILGIVCLSHIIEVAFSIAEIRSLVIVFYVVNESNSIVEKLSTMGLPLPQKLFNILLMREYIGSSPSPEKPPKEKPTSKKGSNKK